MRGSGLLFAVLLLVSVPVEADDDEAWQALREGRALLILRHANAPGLGDPPGFRLSDCSTQRNLDERGRAQAQRWGALLRDRGLAEVRLLSSRWCRALETAEQMALGPVEPLPALDSFFASPASEGRQTIELREVLAGLEPGEVAVLVSHQVNITALTGIFPQSGEGLILARPLAVPPQILARVPPP